jgi:hypothetical protein
LDDERRDADALHAGDLGEQYLIVGRDPGIQTLAPRETRLPDMFFAGVSCL